MALVLSVLYLPREFNFKCLFLSLSPSTLLFPRFYLSLQLYLFRLRKLHLLVFSILKLLQSPLDLRFGPFMSTDFHHQLLPVLLRLGFHSGALLGLQLKALLELGKARTLRFKGVILGGEKGRLRVEELSVRGSDLQEILVSGEKPIVLGEGPVK